jgi:hypothetical protein
VKFYYVNKSSREGETVPVAVKEFKVGSLIASQGRLQSTLTLDKPLPPAIKTDLALSFKDEEFFQSHPTIPPYEELRGEVRTSIEATPASNLKTTEAAERTFANNLELGAAFTSTVETEKDKVTGINKRFRQNVGVLDLQLAPFFTYRTFGEARERANGEVYIPWELITTPLKIDAIVSTGSELKRLALNRIELATEVEFRKLAGLSIGSNIYHLVGRFGQVSDRDFKDFEHGGSFDFRINPGFIEKLLYSEPRAVLPRFDFTVVGVDLALATTRKSEFELAELMRPLDKRRFVRRLRFGGTFELNVSKFLFMKVQDMLYLRGGDEFAMDRGKHYFKAELELPLLSEFTNQGFAQSFAVAATYERGTKPPFTTPDVNAFRIGFRYRSNWSFFR